METRTLISAIRGAAGTTVTVAGWVERMRDQKRMQFIVLRDHTGKLQVIHQKREGDDPLAAAIAGLTHESAVTVTGRVVENPHAKLGGIELVAEDVTVVGACEPHLPIDQNSSPELRMDWRFLDLRSPRNRLVFDVQTTLEHAMREHWRTHGFVEIHSPKLMASASESGAELFRVEYFDRMACLAQSPQFYKQLAMAAGFDRVFEIGPVFRANPSFTTRHDTEFTSIDVEMSWVTSHHDVMDLEAGLLQAAFVAVKEQHGEAIREYFGVEVVVPTLPFPKITVAEAYEIAARAGHEIAREHKGDLDPEGERRAYQAVRERTGHEFVFVTDYPISARPFYHMRHGDAPGLTKSFDLLWKGLEVTTGAQREHRYGLLHAQALEKGLDPEAMPGYMNCFRYGCPPHGGFGLGLTRLLMTLLGVGNVREVTYLYRGPNRLEP